MLTTIAGHVACSQKAAAPSLNSGTPRFESAINNQRLGRRSLWTTQLLYRNDSTIKTFFGEIQIGSVTSLLKWATSNTQWDEESLGDEPTEHQTSITVRPVAWLSFLRMTYGFYLDIVSSAIQGWTHTLRPFCLVPRDAPIFDFCIEGNLSAVKYLISRGEASANDTSPTGWTPLHVCK